MFYQFQAIGDDEDTLSFTMGEDEDVRFFRPHGLKNLLIVDEVQCVNPITDMMVSFFA
jgi:hypothetical protein